MGDQIGASSTIKSKYMAMTGVESISPETSERIDKIEKTLGVRDDDAIWSIFLVLDMYLRVIETQNGNMKSVFGEILQEYRDKGGAINVIENDSDRKFTMANALCAFGMVFLFGAVCFCAGAGLSQFSPAWIVSLRTSSPLAFIMQIPAGWIFFLLASIPAGFVFYRSVQKTRQKLGVTSWKDRLEHAPTAAIALMLVIIGLFAVCQLLFG